MSHHVAYPTCCGSDLIERTSLNLPVLIVGLLMWSICHAPSGIPYLLVGKDFQNAYQASEAFVVLGFKKPRTWDKL
jgi:hypothetical protein